MGNAAHKQDSILDRIFTNICDFGSPGESAELLKLVHHSAFTTPHHQPSATFNSILIQTSHHRFLESQASSTSLLVGPTVRLVTGRSNQEKNRQNFRYIQRLERLFFFICRDASSQQSSTLIHISHNRFLESLASSPSLVVGPTARLVIGKSNWENSTLNYGNIFSIVFGPNSIQ